MTGATCCPLACECVSLPPVVPTRIGRYARIVVTGTSVLVSAYDAQFGDLVVDTISEFAPDFRDKIVGRQIMTPLDLERTIGLTEGNIFQGEILVQQMAFNRPVSGWSRYKTPIRDYWLASSSAHPGGGIMAAPGRLAALEILKSKRGEA